MVVSVIVSIASATTVLGTAIRGLFVYLDRRGDRRLAQHVFDQTRSTDSLTGYVQLRRAQHAAFSLGRSNSETPWLGIPQPNEDQGSPS